MAEKKIKGKVPAAVKEFYDTVPPNRDPRMTGAKYRKYLRGLKAVGKFPGIRTAGALKMSMKDALDDAKKRSGKSTFIQRRITLGGVGSQAAKAAKATKVGKIAAGVAAAALAAKAGLEKLYEKRTGKKPFTKREKKRTLVDKKMGGGMMMRRPMMASEGRFTNRDVQAAKDALKIKKVKPGDRGYKMIQRSLDTIKSNKKMDKKMGGGLMKRKPIMASEGQMTPKGPNRKVNKDAISPEELKKRKRKLIDAMRPREERAPPAGMGMRTGGICRGMGAALRGGDFKGVK